MNGRHGICRVHVIIRSRVHVYMIRFGWLVTVFCWRDAVEDRECVVCYLTCISSGHLMFYACAIVVNSIGSIVLLCI